MRAQHPYKNMPGDDRYLVVSKDESESVLTSLGNAVSGGYDPIFSNQLTVAASAGSPLMYSRIGNVVTVGGLLDVDPSAATSVSFQMSLPVTSDLQSANALAGSGAADAAAVTIYGNSTNNTAFFTWVAAATTPGTLTFSLVYRIE